MGFRSFLSQVRAHRGAEEPILGSTLSTAGMPRRTSGFELRAGNTLLLVTFWVHPRLPKFAVLAF